ncbi:MAG: hypothetical protein E3J35_00925 [Methanomassiliicoccales archaeon]|nr:MAG: hypothetical protein E3J35_00925 [Methanomassiliicoccales archaeon]
MREDREEYDMEEELKDVKDILMAKKVDCPNCRSKVDANIDKCPLCGFAIKKVEDDEFANRLKATMWAPGMDRGVPLGTDVPPPLDIEAEEEEPEPEMAEPELPFLPSLEEEEEEIVEDRKLVGEVLIVRERLKATLSIALVLFGVLLYVITPFFSVTGLSVLVIMVLGSVLLLVGANLAFDVILDRRRRTSLLSDRDFEESFPKFSRRVLQPGDSVGKTVSVFVTFVGGLSYVLLPMLSSDRILVFVGMAVGAVLIVFGVSMVHHSFFRTEHYLKRKEGEVFEAFVESVGEEPVEEGAEWACPVCATPLAEETDVCPECGAEFED